MEKHRMFQEPNCILFYLCNIFYDSKDSLSLMDVSMVGQTILKNCTSLCGLFYL